MKSKINLDYHAWLKTVRVLADKAGLSLVFEDKCQPRTNGRSIYVQKPDATWNREQMVEWMHHIYHEIGHNMPIAKESRKQYIKAPEKSLSYRFMNCLDDVVQEQLQIDEGYEGRTSTITESAHNFMERHKDKFGNMPDNDTKNALDTIHLWSLGLKDSRYHHDSVIDEVSSSGQLPKQSQDWYNALKAGPYEQIFKDIDYYNDPDAWDKLYDLVGKMLEEVFKIPPEQSGHNQGNPDAKSKGDGKGEKAKAKASRGKGKEESGGEVDGEMKPRDHDAEIDWDQLSQHNHSERKPSFHSLTINYDSYKSDGGYVPSVVKEEKLRGKRGHYYSEFVSVPSHTLASTLRKMLLATAKTIHQYGIRAGKLHKRNMYRATLKDAGTYQERIFKRKLENTTLDAAVYVLIDFSGSMGGQKVVNAAHSAILLNDALGSLRVPTELCTFTWGWHDAEHYVVKRFDEKVNQEQLAGRLSEAADNMNGNGDGDSVLWAYNRIKARPEKKKILIVLSDGQPADGNGDYIGFLKQVVKDIEADKHVDIYGIGIMSSAVKKFYSKCSVINEPEELETALLNVIKHKLID